MTEKERYNRLMNWGLTDGYMPERNVKYDFSTKAITDDLKAQAIGALNSDFGVGDYRRQTWDSATHPAGSALYDLGKKYEDDISKQARAKGMQIDYESLRGNSQKDQYAAGIKMLLDAGMLKGVW